MGRYRSKDIWKEILQVDDEACMVYFARVIKNFDSSVTKDFGAKMKAGRLEKVTASQ